MQLPIMSLIGGHLHIHTFSA